MTYGVPYMGSKSKIAREVVENLPPAEVFVDLFAGGCAITHAAMLAGKYKRFIANDLDYRGITLFKNAISGKYKNERRTITRDDFIHLKDTDPLVAICWSFGNNEREYLWGDTSDVKTIAVRMLMADTWQERFEHYHSLVRHILKGKGGDLRHQALERLQRLGGLEALKKINADKRLKISVNSYDKVKIPTNACVYCDPPYRGTHQYDIKLDFDAFYDWLREKDYPIYISEYTMPSDFKCIWEKKVNANLAAKCPVEARERLFVHEKWYDKIHKNDLFGFEDV